MLISISLIQSLFKACRIQYTHVIDFEKSKCNQNLLTKIYFIFILFFSAAILQASGESGLIQNIINLIHTMPIVLSIKLFELQYVQGMHCLVSFSAKKLRFSCKSKHNY